MRITKFECRIVCILAMHLNCICDACNKLSQAFAAGMLDIIIMIIIIFLVKFLSHTIAVLTPSNIVVLTFLSKLNISEILGLYTMTINLPIINN